MSETAGWDAVPTGDDRDVDGTEPAASTAPIHGPRLLEVRDDEWGPSVIGIGRWR